MNVIVKTYSGNVIVRPDTTWEKDNEDIFPQDFIDTLTLSPVLFARICKPGRSVGLKFASRYYDTANYGILLYPENLIENGQEDFAAASCIDHTSFLPSPLYQKCVFGNSENEFILMREQKEIFRTHTKGTLRIEQALEEATKRIYIRTGDLIAIELAPRTKVWNKEDGVVNIHATFCDNETIDFNIR